MYYILILYNIYLYSIFIFFNGNTFNKLQNKFLQIIVIITQIKK